MSRAVNRLQRLRYLLEQLEPMPDAPRMEFPTAPPADPPTFEEMWATVQRRKP